jgi:hypothetical protein
MMTVCAVTSLLSVHILKGRFDRSILFTVSAGQADDAALDQQAQATAMLAALANYSACAAAVRTVQGAH